MKKHIVGVLCLVGLFMALKGSLAHAEFNTREHGYTHFEYQTISSTGIYNLSWSRRVHEIEIEQISTHTIHIDWTSQRTSSVAVAGATPAAQAIDRITGMADAQILDSNTARTKTTQKVQSDEFSVYVSTTDLVGVEPDIRIKGSGW